MNLYLIGYRGSGKSTVAPLIACQLGRDCSDSDDVVEEVSQESIAEIFAQHGEPEFRKRETEAIAKLAKSKDIVVSLGGGAPTFDANRQLIAGSGKTVYLSATTDVLWKRIAGDESTEDRRPDLTDLGGRAEVESVMAERGPVYEACADYTIEVDDLSPQEIADGIVKWFRSTIETDGKLKKES